MSSSGGVAADREALRRFREADYALGSFDHRRHVQIARQLLLESPTSAHDQLRDGLIALVASYGEAVPADRGYHETLTAVWLRLVQAAIARDPCTDFAAFAIRHPELLDGDRALEHYTPERLFSSEARAAFVEPDRVPLP